VTAFLLFMRFFTFFFLYFCFYTCTAAMRLATLLRVTNGCFCLCGRVCKETIRDTEDDVRYHRTVRLRSGERGLISPPRRPRSAFTNYDNNAYSLILRFSRFGRGDRRRRNQRHWLNSRVTLRLCRSGN
jgi:hypothetical protein